MSVLFINDECRMSNDERMTKPEEPFRYLNIRASFVIRASSFRGGKVPCR